MSSPAKDVESFILKDGDRDFIAVISFPDSTRPPGFTRQTLARIVSPAINIWGGIPLSLVSGSTLTLAMKPSLSLGKEKKPSAKGRKAKRKKSPNTGKRSSPTSKGVGKKAKAST